MLIAQSVALCIIAACAVLFGVGILRIILALERFECSQQEADFRAQCLLAESTSQLRAQRSTRASDVSEPSAEGPPAPPPKSDDHPVNPLVATEVNLRG